jgi:hypothetical protein
VAHPHPRCMLHKLCGSLIMFVNSPYIIITEVALSTKGFRDVTKIDRDGR